MKRLIVYLGTQPAGILEEDDHDIIRFSYHPAWLENPAAIPLSRSLPLNSAPFSRKATRAFFAGILPEQDIRHRIAAILGISSDNDFALLEHIGGECAGAISLKPENQPPPDPHGEKLHELNETELTHVLEELPDRPLMAGREGVRLSLAGAQGKLPVHLRHGSIFLPLDDTPSTHIIKPEPDRFTALALNEFFCLTLASEIGLNVPEVKLSKTRHRPYLLIKRYDRQVNDDGQILRIHQEDFCQALGIPPERKYQNEGGPLVRDAIHLLREWSTLPVRDITSFIDGLIFNIIIGNADAHGKNYSFLYPANRRVLAPFYDLVCTLFWTEVSSQLSMNIGGCSNLKEIAQSHWQKFAKETSLGWPMVRERIASISHAVEQKLPVITAKAAQTDPGVATRISDIICSQLERIR